MPSARPGPKPTGPPRRSESPAMQQAKARATVERMAREMYGIERETRHEDNPELRRHRPLMTWAELPAERVTWWLKFVTRLIERGVVIPPPPPETGPPPMAGQESFRGVANL